MFGRSARRHLAGSMAVAVAIGFVAGTTVAGP